MNNKKDGLLLFNKEEKIENNPTSISYFCSFFMKNIHNPFKSIFINDDQDLDIKSLSTFFSKIPLIARLYVILYDRELRREHLVKAIDIALQISFLEEKITIEKQYNYMLNTILGDLTATNNMNNTISLYNKIKNKEDLLCNEITLIYPAHPNYYSSIHSTAQPVNFTINLAINFNLKLGEFFLFHNINLPNKEEANKILNSPSFLQIINTDPLTANNTKININNYTNWLNKIT